MKLTHILRWFDGCPRWVTEWLTPERWAALRHVGHVVLVSGCLTVGGGLLPTPIEDITPRAALRLPLIEIEAPPAEDFAPVDESVPEPAGLCVLLVALSALGMFKWRMR